MGAFRSALRAAMRFSTLPSIQQSVRRVNLRAQYEQLDNPEQTFSGSGQKLSEMRVPEEAGTVDL